MQQISLRLVYGLFSYFKRWNFHQQIEVRHRLFYLLHSNLIVIIINLLRSFLSFVASIQQHIFSTIFLFSFLSSVFIIYYYNVTLCQRNRLHQISGIQQLHIHKGTQQRHTKKKTIFFFFFVNVLIVERKKRRLLNRNSKDKQK